MTIYIRLKDNPDIVTRYDNVFEVLADRESGTIFIGITEDNVVKLLTLNDVISLESN